MSVFGFAGSAKSILKQVFNTGVTKNMLKSSGRLYRGAWRSGVGGSGTLANLGNAAKGNSKMWGNWFMARDLAGKGLASKSINAARVARMGAGAGAIGGAIAGAKTLYNIADPRDNFGLF